MELDDAEAVVDAPAEETVTAVGDAVESLEPVTKDVAIHPPAADSEVDAAVEDEAVAEASKIESDPTVDVASTDAEDINTSGTTDQQGAASKTATDQQLVGDGNEATTSASQDSTTSSDSVATGSAQGTGGDAVSGRSARPDETVLLLAGEPRRALARAESRRPRPLDELLDLGNQVAGVTIVSAREEASPEPPRAPSAGASLAVTGASIMLFVLMGSSMILAGTRTIRVQPAH